MAYQEILYTVANAVATVTLNRPDKLNAWTAVMEDEVRDAMQQAGADPAARVIVLTGAGRGFCAGADMNLLQGIGAKPGARRETALKFDMDKRPDWQTRYSYFPAIPKPIIGAINGPAAGLGLIMALYCDWRYASDAAVFTTSFSRRGLIAEHGISWLLPRLVGQAQALDLLISARKFDAAEALSIGLVNAVFPMASFADRVNDIARDIAENVSPRSTEAMKRQLWATPFQTMAEAVRDANREMRKSFKSEDFKEGVAHFVEKRKARFTGK